MENTQIKIKVIIGSTRQNRFSDKPADWIYGEIKKLEGVEVELLDLRDYPMPFFDEATPPRMLAGKYSNEVVKKWAEKIKNADGFVVISPEYNHGYTAVLKNAFDSIYVEWTKKPIGFISYGSVSGARSIEQLRQVVIELEMIPIRNSINLSGEIYRAVMGEKVPVNPELFKSLLEPVDRVKPFINELIDFARILKPTRS